MGSNAQKTEAQRLKAEVLRLSEELGAAEEAEGEARVRHSEEGLAETEALLEWRRRESRRLRGRLRENRARLTEAADLRGARQSDSLA